MMVLGSFVVFFKFIVKIKYYKMSSSESEASDLEMLHLLSNSGDSDSEENNRRTY